MANFKLVYIEIDGLLYQNIEIDGRSELDNRTLRQNRWH
jgi:hypothetical protein